MEIRVAFHHFARKYDLNLDENSTKLDQYRRCMSGKLSGLLPGLQDNDFIPAASIEVNENSTIDALERAYFLTQNINESWLKSPLVSYLGPEDGIRSSCMGDIYWIPSLNEFYVVAGVGFDLIEDPEILEKLNSQDTQQDAFGYKQSA